MLVLHGSNATNRIAVEYVTTYRDEGACRIYNILGEKLYTII